MPDIYTEYQTDDDGSVINPPVMREYEDRLRDATAVGDLARIATVSEDYEAERKRVADRHNQQVQDRRADDDRLLAEQRQAQEQARADADNRSQEDARRARANALRNAPPTPPQPTGDGNSEDDNS